MKLEIGKRYLVKRSATLIEIKVLEESETAYKILWRDSYVEWTTKTKLDQFHLQEELCDQLNRPASEPSSISDAEIEKEANTLYYSQERESFKHGIRWALSKSSPQKEKRLDKKAKEKLWVDSVCDCHQRDGFEAGVEATQKFYEGN